MSEMTGTDFPKTLKTTVVFRTTEQQETVNRDCERRFMVFPPPLLLCMTRS